MSSRRIAVVALLAVIVGLFAHPALAQKILVRSLGMLSKAEGPEIEGLAVWWEGDSISKKGVVLKFEAYHNQDGRFIGYKYAETAVDSLDAGDKISFFIRDIDFGAYHVSASSGLVDRGLGKGAWRTLTIASVGRVGDTVEISFKEETKLNSGQTTKKLAFSVVDGYLTPIPVP
jgi:hypothetical protein